ncbi:MAG TPA: hypothetical protein DEG17_05080 [Cyanobacteria bacterium UBA11149]|nr:hypothetical protein [Cyanobacteria bacterium UBA11367]HBE59232.1 hypothetical protein [Cyanobacteria bacterium UBA11366]HBK62943.1 hypothetical protein [Cyanobacteria bacterium UBA11166]HBR76878.1 hypothetical protein [Cyanobacteria bacterium UBA11159]HBS69123.1 hypothetical protein [Cyanobacteria bacterium UBA11153]HBW88258.1 hypothetical protein [Cyanobacteria bacterium UBA11149]
MPSPFPGMNPYLEHPEIWPGIHHWLIVEIAKLLSPQLRPKYRVAVEVRIYETIREESLLVGIPDLIVKSSQTKTQQSTSNVAVMESTLKPQKVEVPLPETVKQGYLEIREVATKEVVTTIELISPVNKRSGEGRKQYETKRNRVLGSATHLVEIDLLRRGEPLSVYGSNIKTHYRILVSRGDCRPSADLYGFNVQDAIPLFPIPLKSGDREPLVNLQELLNNVYDQASYDLEIDYTQKPVPPLLGEDGVWLDRWLEEQQLHAPA